MQTEAVKQPFQVGMTHRTDVESFTEEEVRFEIDMCIGCDRCMRACPVPLSAQVRIADLNRATLSDDIPPHIQRFTDECVMCGSCVSVCPVDNHRDLLMLSLKERLGIVWDGKVDMNRVLSHIPAGWSVPQLVSRLREQPLFSDERLVPDNYLLHFVATSKLLVLAPGSVLVREGEYSRTLYFILEGRVECSSLDPNQVELPVAILQRGEYIGETGMVNGQPQTLTARTQGPAIVLEVPEQVMQRLMEIVPSVQSFFERLSVARSVETILQRLALFQGVSSADIHQLAEHATIKRYDRDEQLFSEDNASQPARDALHILLDGFVKVARRTAAGTGRNKTDERIIAYRQGGDYFAGGLDVLGDRRAVTVSSITRATVAELPRNLLKTLLMRYPEVKQRFQERLQLYRQSTAAAHSAVFEPIGSAFADPLANVNELSDAEARAGLHALVDDGVVEGTEVLVIDLDKCIHCNECEVACERRHGHSRMNRKGMVVGNISITTACRQCQDPVCMLCSRAGIARKPGGEVYITESCIGCGICAERCPYDNISIVTLDEQEEAAAAASWQRFNGFFKKGAGKKEPVGRKMLPMANSAPEAGPLNSYRTLDAIEEMRKKIAIKCDLCAGYSNQACVQTCPTGAAFRVNPVSFFGSTEEILRQRAR